jgi:hypothetical protein
MTWIRFRFQTSTQESSEQGYDFVTSFIAKKRSAVCRKNVYRTLSISKHHMSMNINGITNAPKPPFIKNQNA